MRPDQQPDHPLNQMAASALELEAYAFLLSRFPSWDQWRLLDDQTRAALVVAGDRLRREQAQLIADAISQLMEVAPESVPEGVAPTEITSQTQLEALKAAVR